LGGWLTIVVAAPLHAQETLIQIRAFLAKETVNEPGRKAAELITRRSNARLASIAATVNGTESDLRAAALKIMSQLRDFESVEYLFSLVVYWDGRSETTGDFVIQPPASYRFELRPGWDPSGLLDFRLAAYAKEIPDWPPKGSKQEAAAERTLFAAIHPDFFKERMEKVLESDILLAVEEPGLLIVPYRDGTLVLFLMPAVRPQPVFQALPVYPEDLIRQGIAGRGRYRVSIDQKGKVRNVTVKTSMHPFLDDAAVQAIRTWTFEPVSKGLVAVAVSFDWTIDFDPARWPGLDRRAAPGVSEPYSAELERLLALGTEYCERLSAAALDFVCRESIRSLDCALYLPEAATQRGATLIRKETDSKGEVVAIIGPRRAPLGQDPFKTRTHKLVSDFQLIRKQGKIEERRMLLESNDKTALNGAAPPAEKRYTSLKPLFVPVDILAGDRQGSYEFRLAGRENIRGRTAAVIEAVARPGAPVRITAAKIWIDPGSSQILRCETQGLPIEGYEFVFEEASSIGVSPLSTIAISYEEEKNGIVFPSRVKLLIEYPVNVWGVGRRTRIDTDIRYDQYRFFTVETEKVVIRSPY
jgi:TonB family protein